MNDAQKEAIAQADAHLNNAGLPTYSELEAKAKGTCQVQIALRGAQAMVALQTLAKQYNGDITLGMDGIAERDHAAFNVWIAGIQSMHVITLLEDGWRLEVKAEL